MTNRIHIFNTGEISISPKESYGKEIREKHFPEPRDITIPILCFLITSDQGTNTLIDAGVSSENPMGWLGNWMYSPKPTNEIASYLETRGIKKVDELFLTHFHTDHVSGLRQLLEAIEVGKISADQEAHRYARKFASFRWGYSSKMLGNVEINPISDCTYKNGRYSTTCTGKGIECFNFTGHSHGDLGFLVSQSPGSNKKVMLCGDAVESVLSLKDPRPPKKYQANYPAYVEHIKNLRQMASEGTIILSSHDIDVTPNNGNFFGEEYDKAEERQAKALEN